MSTILNTNGTSLTIPKVRDDVKGKFYVITAEWNPDVTHPLRDGAIKVLHEAGVKPEDIVALGVPGTVELVNAAAVAIRKGKDRNETPAAVIVIGCVIRGDTPHFDYVCSIAAQGTAALNAAGETPVIFGVLTVDSPRQAHERAGGPLGNKGSEAACAAIEMANFAHLV